MKKVEYPHLHISSPSKPTCLMILLLLIFSFSVSKHHNLLIATYNVIIVAKSSDLAMFFLFNAVMITILLGSSKPTAEEFDGLFSFPSLEHRFNESREKESDHVKDLSLETYGEHYAFSDDEGEDGDEENHGYDGYDEDNDDDIGEEDEDSEDDDFRDGDLKMKIDEFIAKMNNTWREEMLRERRHLCTEPT